MNELQEWLLSIGQPADVLAETIIKLTCQCGCGKTTFQTLSPQILKAGGVGIWQTELLEVAIGFHCGLYELEFTEVFQKAGHNVEEIK